MIRIPFVGGEVWVKWPRMSREECPQHMRLLGQAMAGGLVPAGHRSRSGEAGCIMWV